MMVVFAWTENFSYYWVSGANKLLVMGLYKYTIRMKTQKMSVFTTFLDRPHIWGLAVSIIESGYIF